MYAVYAVITNRIKQREEQREWEAYTANAMGAIANVMGWKIELYTNLIEEKKNRAIHGDETAEQIRDSLLAKL